MTTTPFGNRKSVPQSSAWQPAVIFSPRSTDGAPTLGSLRPRLTSCENKDFQAFHSRECLRRELFQDPPGSDRPEPPERLTRRDEDRGARERRRWVAAGRPRAVRGRVRSYS